MTAPSLTDFLLARYAEDEERGNQAAASLLVFNSPERPIKPRNSPLSPFRVLADVEAKRRIVLNSDDRLRAAAQDFPKWASEARVEAVTGAANIAEETLRLLALPYADHEDFQEEWRV